MFDLTVLCTRCGRKFRVGVSETCAPSQVKCSCGASFSLSLEGEERRGPIPDSEYSDEQTGSLLGDFEALSRVS